MKLRHIFRFVRKIRKPLKPIDLWFKDKGDENLKHTFEHLTNESVVLDFGGYKGDWANEIFRKYGSHIHVFEPIQEYYQNILTRFSSNDKVNVHPFAIGVEDKNAEFYIDNDRTSSRSNSVGEVRGMEKIRYKKLDDFMVENQINTIDLIKMNIEGDEFDLLEHMLNRGIMDSCNSLVVQFHNNFDEARYRMELIQEGLSRSHNLKWGYDFVWEKWDHKALGI